MAAWHEEMANAVADRKKAINGVTRWLEKKAKAEEKIEELSAQRAQAEAAPVPVAAQDDGVLLDSDLRPVFGVTDAAE